MGADPWPAPGPCAAPCRSGRRTLTARRFLQVDRWCDRMSGWPGKSLIGIGGRAGEEATVFNRSGRGTTMNQDTTIAHRRVEIVNAHGLHMRPAGKFVGL